MKDNLEFLDILSIMSFALTAANFNENLSQSDLISAISSQTDKLLSELHGHLEVQDQKIDKLISMMEGKYDTD